MQIRVVGGSDDYLEILGSLPDGVRFVSRISSNIDIVHFFSNRRAELAKALKSYRAKLKPTTMVWVSWPKKSSKVSTDITEDTVRELALPLGFVDIKVAAVTEVWSGLKLVVRKELR